MLIIGCGNRQRGDDAAGILVAERLREIGIAAEVCSGQAADLIDAWADAEDVIVVDAVVTGAPAGTVETWDTSRTLTTRKTPATTHGFGVAEAIEIARALDRLPARLQVYGIEARQFEPGSEVSPEVAAGIQEVVRRISDAVRAVSSRRPGPSGDACR